VSYRNATAVMNSHVGFTRRNITMALQTYLYLQNVIKPS